MPHQEPTHTKMSAFRTNNPRNNQRREEEAYWRAQDALRAREAEQKRIAAQNQEKTVAQRDETVFPSLGGARSAVARRDGPATGPRPMGFATKAKEWKTADEEAAAAAARVRMLEAEALHTERRNNNVDGIFIWRPRAAEVVEEESVERPFRESADGWTDVSHRKVRAPRRALTAAEVDEMYAEDREEGEEYNGEFFENNKHDHR